MKIHFTSPTTNKAFDIDIDENDYWVIHYHGAVEHQNYVGYVSFVQGTPKMSNAFSELINIDAAGRDELVAFCTEKWERLKAFL